MLLMAAGPMLGILEVASYGCAVTTGLHGSAVVGFIVFVV
jgi:hypothetical protein